MQTQSNAFIHPGQTTPTRTVARALQQNAKNRLNNSVTVGVVERAVAVVKYQTRTTEVARVIDADGLFQVREAFRLMISVADAALVASPLGQIATIDGVKRVEVPRVLAGLCLLK